MGYPQMPVGNRSTCRNKVLGSVNDTPAATLVYRLPAHSVPTICPQLQITPMNYSDGFSQLDGVLDLWTRPEIEFESHRGHQNCICGSRHGSAPHRRGLPTYFQTRSAVMSISIQPWHGPLKMSVCMTPASVPLAWGV